MNDDLYLIHIDKAMLLIEQNRFELAKDELYKALSYEAEDPLIYGLLSICMREQKKFDEALELVNKAIGLDPEDANNYFIKSIIYGEIKKYNLAEELLNQALSLDNSCAEYYFFFSKIKVEKLEFVMSLKYAEQGLEIEPENENGLLYRAKALYFLDRISEAEKCLEQLHSVNPENASAHNFKGFLFSKKKLYDKAFEHHQEALSLAPEYSTALINAFDSIKQKNKFYNFFYKIHLKDCEHKYFCPLRMVDFFTDINIYFNKDMKKYMPVGYLKRYKVGVIFWTALIFLYFTGNLSRLLIIFLGFISTELGGFLFLTSWLVYLVYLNISVYRKPK
jgi:tetratricopeptide (TPR) repeat protein